MRGNEIMGEATKQLPAELKEANADIPWIYMAAVSNRTAHAYFGLDDLLLFETIETQLKRLLPRLEALVRDHRGEE
jgi:uncharacterized protein with HEPN domain